MMALMVTRTIIIATAGSMLTWSGCCAPTSRHSCERRELATSATAPTVVSDDGDRVAAYMWISEGVADTTIRRRGALAPGDTMTLHHAVPICWSPVDGDVILVRTACANDDEHLVLLRLDSRGTYDLSTLDQEGVSILGSPWARFIRWGVDDTITYEDRRSDERTTEFQVAGASGQDAVILQIQQIQVGRATFEIQIVTSPRRARYCVLYVFRIDGEQRKAIWALDNRLAESLELDLWTATPTGESDTVIPGETLQAVFGMESCLLVARGWTGGMTCCNIESVVGLLSDGTVAPLMVSYDLNRCSVAPFVGQYPNGTPRLGLVACEYGLFEGMFGLGFGAGPPRPQILFEIVPVAGKERWGLRLCPALQREYYARIASTWPRNCSKIKTECQGFTNWQDGWVPSGLVETAVDLFYGGRGRELDVVLDEVWPAHEPGKAEFLREFAAIVRRSQWFGELRTMNPDCSWLTN